jgi:hypothetical protein
MECAEDSAAGSKPSRQVYRKKCDDCEIRNVPCTHCMSPDSDGQPCLQPRHHGSLCHHHETQRNTTSKINSKQKQKNGDGGMQVCVCVCVCAR